MAETTTKHFVDYDNAKTITARLRGLIGEKQDALTVDASPASGSANPVSSGGVYTALAGKQAALTAGTNVTISSTNTISASFTESDPTVPAWAKAATKPSYTASEVGAYSKSEVDAKGYQTAAQVTSSINAAVGGITGFDATVVASLPTSGKKGTIYLVADKHSDANDNYDEYIYVTNGTTSAWEKVGNTDVDLSAKQDALTTAQLSAANSGITAADKTRLDTLTDDYIKGLLEDLNGVSF